MLRLALAGLAPTTALAQEPPVTPARSAPALMRITGTVVAEGGLPVAGTTVSLPLSSNHAITDTQGAFELTNVRAGSHVLDVNKPGLFQVGRNGRPGTRQITVRAEENVRGLTLTLARGGVITGRIVDDLGEPVDQLQVSGMRWGRGTGRASCPDAHRPNRPHR